MAALELSLVLWSGGYSLVAVHGLLIAMASPVAEHKWILYHWTTRDILGCLF